MRKSQRNSQYHPVRFTERMTEDGARDKRNRVKELMRRIRATEAAARYAGLNVNSETDSESIEKLLDTQ